MNINIQPLIITLKTLYVLPYNDEKKINKFIINKIKGLMNKIGESYEIKNIYSNGTRYIGLEIITEDFTDIKLDYLETSLRSIKDYRPRRKIMIEI